MTYETESSGGSACLFSGDAGSPESDRQAMEFICKQIIGNNLQPQEISILQISLFL